MKAFTISEVSKHNTEKNCWVVVNGQVLDVTNFLSEHPGGKKVIMIYAGRDATEEFNMMHQKDVIEKYAPLQAIDFISLPKHFCGIRFNASLQKNVHMI